MKKIFFLTLCTALTFVGCKKEKEPDYGSKNLTIKASIAAVKSVVGQDGVQWAAGDEITVVCDGESYAFTTNAGGQTADFTTAENLTQAMVGENPLTAYYGCNMYGAFTIAQNQTVTAGVNSTKLPMYAYTASAPSKAEIAMEFIPAASFIEIQLSAADLTVNKVELAPVDENKVTGNFAGQGSINALQGKVTQSGSIKSVCAIFDGGASAKSGLVAKLPVNWFSVEGGLNVIITYNDTQVYTETLFGSETFASYSGTAAAPAYKYTVLPVEMVVGPRNFYVKADAAAGSKGLSWESPCTLDYALASAESGSTINIAAGTYSPAVALKGYEGSDTHLNTFEIASNIAIVGGFPANATTGAKADPTANLSILDGKSAVYHVVCVTAVPAAGEKVSISGITVCNGDGSAATDSNVTSAVNGKEYVDNYAAGIYVLGSDIELTDVTIKDNKGVSAAGAFVKGVESAKFTGVSITGNTSSANGAGLWLQDAKAEIKDCLIDGNVAAGVAGGLYIYGDTKEKALRATDAAVTNTRMTNNKATTNMGGLYVRGADATSEVTAAISSCEISWNKGTMGAAFGTTYCTADFDSCTIAENVGTGNGMSLVYPGAVSTFRNCLFKANTGATLAAAIYIYSAAEKAVANVVNCEFTENVTAGRGGALYARAAAVAGVELNVINSTIHGNTSGSTGSAIAIYGAAGKVATANVYSSTIYNNTCTRTSTTPGGAIGLETAGTVANVYNSIVAGNIWSAATANADIYSHASGVVKVVSSAKGSSIYDASGAVASGKTFDTSVLSKKTDSSKLTAVYKVVSGDALTCGMTGTDVAAKSGSIFASGIAEADQWGNSRTSAVMGAYVGQ